MSVLEIVFVRQCEMFVCLDVVHLFSLGRKTHRSANGASIYKMSIFPTLTPLKSV